MIQITLQQIKDRNPCGDYDVLVNHLGKNFPMDEPFPMSTILDVEGFEAHPADNCAWAMQCLPEYSRMWRLYAIWCARQVEYLMEDERGINALNAAERHANGEATDEELAAAGAAAWAAAGAAAWAAAGAAAWAAAGAAAWVAAGDAQSEKLREILTAGEWMA